MSEGDGSVSFSSEHSFLRGKCEEVKFAERITGFIGLVRVVAVVELELEVAAEVEVAVAMAVCRRLPKSCQSQPCFTCLMV